MESEIFDLISAHAPRDVITQTGSLTDSVSGPRRKRRRCDAWRLAESVVILNDKGENMRLSLEEISPKIVEIAETVLSGIEGIEDYFERDPRHCI